MFFFNRLLALLAVLSVFTETVAQAIICWRLLKIETPTSNALRQDEIDAVPCPAMSNAVP